MINEANYQIENKTINLLRFTAAANDYITIMDVQDAVAIKIFEATIVRDLVNKNAIDGCFTLLTEELDDKRKFWFNTINKKIKILKLNRMEIN